jgi:hypothetical protein
MNIFIFKENVGALVRRTQEEDRLVELAVGVCPNVPLTHGFRLPLRTFDEITKLCQILEANPVLKKELVREIIISSTMLMNDCLWPIFIHFIHLFIKTD